MDLYNTYIDSSYPLKVWLVAILISPIILLILLAIISGVYWTSGFITVYILTVFLKTVLSLPAILLHLLAFKELVETINSMVVLKAILNTIAIMSLLCTYYIADLYFTFRFGTDTLVVLASLISSLCITGFYFKIKRTLP